MSSKSFQYTDSFGDVIEVFPELDVYRSTDNLYVRLKAYDEDLEDIDHYCDVTVSIFELPFLQSTIDTNNNGDKMVKFLEENGFGVATGTKLPSGRCWYPVFQFDPERLKEIDPDTFAFYAKLHHQRVDEKPALDSQIKKAEEQTQENSSHKKESREQSR